MERLKPNRWLTNETFLERIVFPDKKYLFKLFRLLSKYLIKCPVPVVTSWNFQKPKLIFKVGQENVKSFVINSQISQNDFINLIERWLRKFFPQYIYEYKKERLLTSKEAIEYIKNGNATPENVFNIKIKEKFSEVVMIEKVFMLDDEFRININGKKFFYLSIIPISELLRNFRRLKYSDDKNRYLTSNSKFINPVSYEELAKNTNKEIPLDYKGEVLKNFFRINVVSYFNWNIKRIDNNKYKWFLFTFQFDDEKEKEECFEIYKNFRDLKIILLEKSKEKTNIKIKVFNRFVYLKPSVKEASDLEIVFPVAELEKKFGKYPLENLEGQILLNQDSTYWQSSSIYNPIYFLNTEKYFLYYDVYNALKENKASLPFLKSSTYFF